MLLQNGDRIVFTGDSTTDAGRARPVGEGLHAGVGDGYVRQIENFLNVLYPDWSLWISNTGSSGDTSRGLKARWQNDVMNLNPDWVSVMIGINDIWRQFDSPGVRSSHVYPAEYRENLCEMMERTLPAVKGVILMSPFYMEPCREDFMRAMTDQYVKICEEVAKKYNCHYINIQAAFDEYLQYRHSSYISWDRVHPGHIGSLIIAREFLKAIGIDRAFL
ncbi:MAG: SGNH/GDSL hydrolase family protein [Clostridia bacterium]|nr:SGNH/GDSL hydrolase family protein [Clostridia bacterium]MBQ5354905.1 SGNH/GDSL hydrolase family protein [Clostridia bacterium]